MRPLVQRQAILALEGFPAVAALVGARFRVVALLVGDEMILSNERALALVAFERSLAGVNAPVVDEPVLASERLAAFLTFERRLCNSQPVTLLQLGTMRN